MAGADCFYLTNNELFVRADAPISESVIRNRLISVIVKVNWWETWNDLDWSDYLSLQATEQSLAERSSQVVVNIPVSGDDHQPRLQDFYQAEVLADGSLSGNTTFTATDDDVLIPNDCNFRLIPGAARVKIFMISPTWYIQIVTGLIWKNWPKIRSN